MSEGAITGSRILRGVWGGTFDPVHNGHIELARELKHTLALDEMYLVPCNIPAHRAVPVANAAQRSAMLKLAVQNVPELEIDERELQRGGVSYTVETLESLRNELGPECALVLCMGEDAFDGFATWQRYIDILALAHIVVVQRAGAQVKHNTPAVDDLLRRHETHDKQSLRQASAGAILKCTATHWPVSSTDIRHRLMRDEDVSRFVPSSVMDFIQQQQLYRKQ